MAEWKGKVGVAKRIWFTAVRDNGVPRSGLAAADFTIVVRNPTNTTTMAAPTVTEVGTTAVYFFDVDAAFSTAHAAGTYGVKIAIDTFAGSGAPQARRVISGSIKFTVSDLDDLAKPGDAMDLVADAVDATAVAASAVAEIEANTLAAIAALNDLSTTDVATVLAADPRLILIEKILRNKFHTDPVTGVLTVFDNDSVTPLITATIYEDIAGTQLYRGLGVDRRERLT